MALSKAFAGASPADRMRNHLDEKVQKLRARIAVADVNAGSVESHQLYSARVYLDGAQKRHDAALRDYRAAQEQLAAVPEPRRGVMDRLMGRHYIRSDTEALERRVDAARTDLIAAEHSIRGAEANLARVEKAEAGERRRIMGEAEVERQSALDLLAEVVMAQRMVKAYPTVIYSGPAFIAWAGGKIERRRRRGLRNPFATNIWGLPIEP